MNEVAMMDKNLSVDRTPELIAIEINSIKEQTRKMVLFNSIEIGRRLCEAKAMIPHGGWSDWLEKSVDYSQRTANNLMRIFEEYGSDQITMFCDNANSQAFANLNYSQAVALLGLPEDQRESFVKNNDVENMSTRELQQAIMKSQELAAKLLETEVELGASKNQAESATRIAEQKANEVQDLIDEKLSLQEILEKERMESKSEIDRLSDLLKVAKTNNNSDEKIKQLEAELKEAKNLAEKLSQELDNPDPIEVTAAEVVEKIPEEVERELAELREKSKELDELKNKQAKQAQDPAVIKFKDYFDSLVSRFNDILGTLENISDEQQCLIYKGAVSKLIEKMSERLRLISF